MSAVLLRDGGSLPLRLLAVSTSRRARPRAPLPTPAHAATPLADAVARLHLRHLVLSSGQAFAAGRRAAHLGHEPDASLGSSARVEVHSLATVLGRSRRRRTAAGPLPRDRAAPTRLPICPAAAGAYFRGDLAPGRYICGVSPPADRDPDVAALDDLDDVDSRARGDHLARRGAGVLILSARAELGTRAAAAGGDTKAHAGAPRLRAREEAAPREATRPSARAEDRKTTSRAPRDRERSSAERSPPQARRRARAGLRGAARRGRPGRARVQHATAVCCGAPSPDARNLILAAGFCFSRALGFLRPRGGEPLPVDAEDDGTIDGASTFGRVVRNGASSRRYPVSPRRSYLPSLSPSQRLQQPRRIRLKPLDPGSGPASRRAFLF